MTAELVEIRDFLAGHPPFEDLPPRVLDTLPAQLTLRYFKRGTSLMSLGADNDVLYVLRSGAVDIFDEHGALVERGDIGTCFGTTTLISGNPSKFTVTTIEDSLALIMPAATFHALADEHQSFSDYFKAQRASRMRTAVESMHLADTGDAVLKTRVRDIVRPPLLKLPQTATIRDAAKLMATQNRSALLIHDGSQIAGVVTDRDLRNRVLAAGRDPGDPVSSIMTKDVVSVGADTLAFEVLLQMSSRNIHHVPVCDEGQPIGILSAGDLLRLEHSSPVYLVGDISRQPDLDGLIRAAHRLPLVVERLVGQDATADDIGHVVTAVGDAIERRLLELTHAELGPAPAAYCWVVLGSRARQEQGVAGDQDNALIYADDLPAGVSAEEVAAYFARLADRVVAGLEACGYPRCPGDVMATNPRWRAPLATWRRYFHDWIRQPEPDAVLNASIFFDMRPVVGDGTLFTQLQEYVLSLTPEATIFLAHLAKNVLHHEPPLGFFRGLVLEKHGDKRDTLDLKKGGINAVVELARVHALAKGNPAVNTQARLSTTVAAGLLSAHRAQNVKDAYEFISYVRLRHQVRQLRKGRRPDNFVAADELTSFEKRHLKDAFYIIRKTQSLLSQSYPLYHVS